MRIVHVVLQVQTGGQERFILNLSRELARRGHEVSVISLTEGGDLRPDFAPIPVIDVPRSARGGIPGLYLRLYRALHALRPDVVHTHNPAPLIYAVPAARAARAQTVVHTKHGANASAYSKKSLALARASTRLLTAFVSVSETTGEAAGGPIGEHPRAAIRHVIPNGIPLQQFGADPTARGRARAELGIPFGRGRGRERGEICAGEGLPAPRSLDGAAPRRGDPARPRRRRGASAARSKRPSLAHVPPSHRAFVRLTGARRDVPDLFAAFDVFVLSSMSEGLPLVIPEAMASRLPIVATAVGGLPGIVPREVGRLVPHGDAGALTKAIAELTDSAPTRRTLGEAAYAYAHQRFSLAPMTTAYERLYRA